MASKKELVMRLFQTGHYPRTTRHRYPKKQLWSVNNTTEIHIQQTKPVFPVNSIFVY